MTKEKVRNFVNWFIHFTGLGYFKADEDDKSQFVLLTLGTIFTILFYGLGMLLTPYSFNLSTFCIMPLVFIISSIPALIVSNILMIILKRVSYFLDKKWQEMPDTEYQRLQQKDNKEKPKNVTIDSEIYELIEDDHKEVKGRTRNIRR